MDQIKKYVPYNEQERRDKAEIIKILEGQHDIFSRKNVTAHVTSSAWVTNAERNKVLMAYHNIYDSWSWLGGHADGEENLLAVAMKEVREESGLKDIRPILEDIFSIELLAVNGHEKRGQYVPSHLHLNVTYLIEAKEEEGLKMKPDENSGVAWFGLDEAVAASTELWFRERVYVKLNEKLQSLIKK